MRDSPILSREPETFMRWVLWTRAWNLVIRAWVSDLAFPSHLHAIANASSSRLTASHLL